ncbi:MULTISPECIES: class II poly(R)-hydroxyalkanoic acid synthase [Pseudomonas]|jgi:polyhydroxyalkanoate synthase|uniref:class II poly(R)-hydroxyalkanoic acid synthase n=1 Tax=Pseudomonas TaxID=286 RepID=UPI00084AF0C0|nr:MULTISPECIES: class II poly(R)-hydroxyalkanoic acid synthase [Pseudomonas]MEA3171549.1 poly[(R)-3-hydroxyalkanoate] polymerase subunit PhaC [Pseudomonas sp.]MBC8785139.1 class II poly(R)-hydroxyalkanoic acid synthase [Pseudomonas fluorescens]MDD5442127.1 class II poly(R)-hydroxyalkanoic acid synthase [Pseudomonas fluorescens]OEC74270.1 class II poly(R)-hydroxyalkanoic acid synthase [Pseudomonas sp. AP19]OPB09654.1 class II poly(R)-hydroxyalkanoic acid synthase [Pseudomonas fluorescens]
MRERPVTNPAPIPAAFINAQNAITGLRGRDLLATLRSVASHGLRNPVHTARHALALSGQLGRVLLGETVHEPNPNDARFIDPTWKLNPLYRRSLQAYLSWQKQTRHWIDDSALSADDRARAHFAFALFNDAVSPSNTLLNPLAIKELLNSGGNSVVRGVSNLFNDLLHNNGLPSQVSKHAFEVGKTVATTPGSVVFRNELLELIQYKPMSEKQYAKPLLIVPPQINKYYIFDLSPANSFVQYALKNSLQTFMVSWRNPDVRHREWGLSTYVAALEEALNVCRAITGAREVNLMGACAGGLTIAALQGHLQAKRQLRRISSASYLVSLLDSQIDSPATLFADEQTLEAAKRRSYQQGVLDGRDMAKVFAWMRPNDLIWNYWINNYLLGKEPPAFDILYWNNDNTRLPAALHGDLLDFFKHNPLSHPGGLEVCGTPIDLQKVTVDSFSVAGINDHITPWDAVYRSTQLLGGERRFVLSNSGHIQSILNPPGNPKANYVENPKLSSDPRAWYYDASHVEGSWWPQWLAWIQQRSGVQRETLTALGNQNYPPMEAAPGTYVRVR